MLEMFISYCQKDSIYADYIDLYFKDKEVTMTSDNEKYLNKMREDMGVLLKKYYHITDEDLEAIDTFSSARIEQCLIQRG